MKQNYLNWQQHIKFIQIQNHVESAKIRLVVIILQNISLTEQLLLFHYLVILDEILAKRDLILYTVQTYSDENLNP